MPVVDVYRDCGAPSDSVFYPTGRISLASADGGGMCPGFPIEPRQQERRFKRFSCTAACHLPGLGEIQFQCWYRNFNEADKHVLFNRPRVHHERLLFLPFLVLITINYLHLPENSGMMVSIRLRLTPKS
jgi:hypothetical protein